MKAVIYELSDDIDAIDCNENHETLVFVKDTLSEIDRDTLRKIFMAVGKSLEEEVSLVHSYNDRSFDINAALIQGITKIIFFGHALEEVPFQSRKTYNYPLTFEGFTMLISRSIELIRTNKEEKMKFWTALKALYKI